jgi:hypothetical protein
LCLLACSSAGGRRGTEIQSGPVQIPQPLPCSTHKCCGHEVCRTHQSQRTEKSPGHLSSNHGAVRGMGETPEPKRSKNKAAFVGAVNSSGFCSSSLRALQGTCKGVQTPIKEAAPGGHSVLTGGLAGCSVPRHPERGSCQQNCPGEPSGCIPRTAPVHCSR